MKVAVVHEWLVNYAGSERVLEQILHLYPEADLFSVCDFLPEGERDFILRKKVTTSFIQILPKARTKYRIYLPLMPYAMRRLDLSRYDLIISNSHSVAKGVRKQDGQLQICYCHTPMRYAWDLKEQYLRDSGLNSGIKGFAARAMLDKLRAWDLKTSIQVDHFLANSCYIKDRIKRAYNRDAAVIYPPVDVDSFRVEEKKDDFFLTVSRMVPYKKIDLIVDAFTESGLPLVVIGDGPDYEKIRSRAGKNVAFLGFRDNDVLRHYMQKARAFIFAADEDFGIVPVEAQACGTPVIAYGKGGVTETVVPFRESEVTGHKSQAGARRCLPHAENSSCEHPLSPTGVFFHEQNAESLNYATKRFMSIENQFNATAIRKNAERFSIDRFRRELKIFTDDKIDKFFVQSRYKKTD